MNPSARACAVQNLDDKHRLPLIHFAFCLCRTGASDHAVPGTGQRPKNIAVPPRPQATDTLVASVLAAGVFVVAVLTYSGVQLTQTVRVMFLPPPPPPKELLSFSLPLIESGQCNVSTGNAVEICLSATYSKLCHNRLTQIRVLWILNELLSFFLPMIVGGQHKALTCW